jgi:pantoate kinase
MAIVHTDDIKDNMILSEEVKDIKGRLLLKKGQQMGPSHIRILKMWGVTEVNVAGGEEGEKETESAIDQKQIEKTREDVRQNFRHVDLDHPSAKELFRLAVQFRTGNDSSEGIIAIPSSKLGDSVQLTSPDIRKKNHVTGG